MTDQITFRGLLDSLVFDPLWRLQKRNELRREMESMDDRALNDIGLSRADIPRIVAQAYPAGAKRSGHGVSASHGAHAAS